MKVALALAFILPFVAPPKADESWQPYTSIDSRIRFEMPTEPVERRFCTQSGTTVRSFVSKKAEMVYEAVAIQMTDDLKTALKEAVSDAEVSVSRQVLDGMVEDFLQEMETKASKTEYSRFKKLNCRITLANLANKRESKVMSIIGKEHIYMLIVSYPKGPEAEKTIKKFYESIYFED